LAYNVSAGDIIEVTIRGSINLQTTLSILHYRLATITPQDGPTLAGLFNGEINSALPSCLLSAYADCCSEDMIILEVGLQWIYPIRYARLNYTAVIGTGVVPSPCLPPAVATALTKRSDLAGRSKQGTLHMPGVPTSFVGSGLLNAPAIAAYNSLGTLLNDTVTPTGSGGSDFIPIIFHRSSPAGSVDITNVVVQDTSRTMRRRVVGRGI
jgi:hypothetical protein